MVGTATAGASEGPCQAIEAADDFGLRGPGGSGRSRRTSNTINDMDQKGPCPFILQS